MLKHYTDHEEFSRLRTSSFNLLHVISRPGLENAAEILVITITGLPSRTCVDYELFYCNVVYEHQLAMGGKSLYLVQVHKPVTMPKIRQYTETFRKYRG